MGSKTRVVPNTDDFKRDLERQLQSIRDEEIRIPVKLDLDKADLERQLRELNTESIKIPVNFDVENVQDDINRATKGARAGAVKVPLELDSDDLEAQIARVTQELRDLDGQEVTPEVILQATDLREELRRLKAELASLSAQERDVRIGEDGITEVRSSVFNLEAALSELQRDPVQIDFDLRENDLLRNIAEIEVELDKLDGKEVTPEVGARIAEALAALAEFQRRLNELDDRRIEVVADLDVDTLRADARIQAFLTRVRARRTIKLDVDVDNDSIGRASNAILRGVGSVLENIGGLISRSFEGIGSAIANIGGLTRGFVNAAIAAARLVLLVGQLGAISVGLSVAGAAITAAWGGVSTVIADVSAAVALIGVPIAAVMLGLDGIKAAASKIAPEFTRLKASIAEVFERGLTPVLQRLATATFPALRAGLRGTAAVLVEMAREMSNVVIRATEIGQLKAIFDNVNNSIRLMAPGITDITKAFLLLAQQKSAFDVLVTAVNTFGAAFRQNVIDLISDGTLEKSFRGLEGVLASLAIGFSDLVTNGITVFANAAPGIKSFLDDLTGFFNRFDWASLGESVGGVFRGLGETLRNVPQGTIDSIEQSFARLSQVFQDKAFQAGLQEIIALIPGAIDWIGRLASAFTRTALALRGSYDVIVGAVKSIALALQALTDDPSLLFSDKFKAELDAANEQVARGLGLIEESYASFDPQLPPSNISGQIGGELDTVVATAEQKMAALRTALQKGMTEAQSAMVGGWKGTGTATVAAATAALAPVPAVGSAAGKGFFEAWDAELDQVDAATKENLTVIKGTVGTELAEVPPAAAAAVAPLPGEVAGALGQVPPAAETALAPLQQLEALRGMRDQFTLAAADSMHAMAVGVQSGITEVQNAFKTGMDQVTTNLNSSFTQGMVAGVQSGMGQLAAVVTAGMPAIQAAFNFENIGLQVGTAFIGMTGTFRLGMASLAAAVTEGIPAIQAGFNFSTIQPQVGALFIGLTGTFNLGMAGLATAVTTGMIAVQAAFTTGLAGLTSAVQLTFGPQLSAAITGSLVAVVPAVNIGMLGIIDAVRTGGTLMIATLSVAIGLMATEAGTRMQAVANMVDAGMQGVTDAIISNMTIAQQVMSNGIAGLAEVALAAMGQVAAAISTGMTQATAAVQSGMAGLAGAAQAGMVAVAGSVQAGMSQAVAAVEAAGARIGAAGTAAMAQFGAAVVAGMAQATAAVASGTAQMNNQFTQLGQQIITTATQSMAQFGNAVRSGMSQAVSAVQAGVAAMTAALRAGSGQFRAVGVQMMQGLRAGILSQAGSIAAAAASVVSQAVAAARAAAQVRSPSRVFMGIGANMGEGLALGMEASGARVAQAADRMAASAIDSFDSITSRVAGSDWADGFSSKVEASIGDTQIDASNADVVGQVRALRGDVSMTAGDAAIVAQLKVLVALLGARGGAAASAQSHRVSAELGAI